MHPGAAGHLLMAALVLDAMGEPATVASVLIDAKKGVAAKLADGRTRNAVVSAVTAATNAVGFTYAPKALPFPALPEYLADDRIYPLTRKFNQETIKVTGLAPGKYALRFDDVKVGTFTADEFAAGVNVALLDTPNQRLAKTVATLAARLVARENAWRTIVLNYRNFRGAGIAKDDYAAQDRYMAERLARMKAENSPWYEAHVHITDQYKGLRAHAAEIECEIEDVFERINAVRPLVSRVTILPPK